MHLAFFFCVCYVKLHFLRNADPRNQIKLFLLCQPIDPTFFAVFVRSFSFLRNWSTQCYPAMFYNKKKKVNKMLFVKKKKKKEEKVLNCKPIFLRSKDVLLSVVINLIWSDDSLLHLKHVSLGFNVYNRLFQFS